MSMPVSPALPALEVVQAPYRRGTPEANMNAARKQTCLPARGKVATAAVASKQYETSARIALLNELTAQQLREEWRRLHRGQPPRLSRDLLIRTIAYRLQELAYGGLARRPSGSSLR